MCDIFCFDNFIYFLLAFFYKKSKLKSDEDVYLLKRNRQDQLEREEKTFLLRRAG